MDNLSPLPQKLISSLSKIAQQQKGIQPKNIQPSKDMLPAGVKAQPENFVNKPKESSNQTESIQKSAVKVALTKDQKQKPISDQLASGLKNRASVEVAKDIPKATVDELNPGQDPKKTQGPAISKKKEPTVEEQKENLIEFYAKKLEREIAKLDAPPTRESSEVRALDGDSENYVTSGKSRLARAMEKSIQSFEN